MSSMNKVMDLALYREHGEGDAVPMCVVYREPADFPGVPYVVRKWEIQRGSVRPTEIAVACGSLGYARMVCASILSPGAVRFERDGGDDLCIVESWV